MTSENYLQALAVLMDRRPFEMFSIELKNGKRFEVDSPMALSARGGVSVFIAPGGNFVIFDHDSVSEIMAEPVGTASNGPTS